MPRPVSLNANPVFEPIQSATFALGGEIGRRLDAVTQQWILPAPFANPAMLEMFRNRDRVPYQNQVPWAGEFAGKYLTHAVQIHRLTRDKKLRWHIDWFLGEFVRLQAEDGYLGPWSKAFRMKIGGPNGHVPWDAWGHYHAMLGLILWHADTGDTRALQCAKRIGDFFCDRFLHSKTEKLHDTGAHEMNQAPIHSLAILYKITGEKKYLDMARKIEKEFAIPPAGDYLRAPLAGKEFWETPKPRWESLHPIMGLAELWWITGDKQYRTAFERLWWSMLKGDRHNNGGFTSGEQAYGNPYHDGAIETCCTIAWMAMSVEMLRMTGESIVADEIEISLLNSGIGMMSPSGRWVTYNTPMHGDRKASAHEIVFQARAGSPELNCCSVNGPRALGMICEWGVMTDGKGLVLNYYGPGSLSAPLTSGNVVKLTQNTDYPRNGHVEVMVQPERAEKFELSLRIPYWSEQTSVAVNGKSVHGVKAGSYLRLTRTWAPGDRIDIDLDFRPHFWVKSFYTEVVDFDAQWTVFEPMARLTKDSNIDAPPTIAEYPSPEGLLAPPRVVEFGGTTHKAIKAQSKAGVIACRNLFPTSSSANSASDVATLLPVTIAFTTITSPKAQEMELWFAADWWIEWYLNGKKIYSNMDRGNTLDLAERRNQVKLSLKKGRNVVAVRIAGGRVMGCWMSVGRALTDAELIKKLGRGKTPSSASIYRGPILLAYDPRNNTLDPAQLPALNGDALDLKPVEMDSWLQPWMLMETTGDNGKKVRLCDFGSAGNAGNNYLTWLKVRLSEDLRTEFSRTNPLRSRRAGESQ